MPRHRNDAPVLACILEPRNVAHLDACPSSPARNLVIGGLNAMLRFFVSASFLKPRLNVKSNENLVSVNFQLNFPR